MIDVGWSCCDPWENTSAPARRSAVSGDAGKESDGGHVYDEAARIFRCRTPIVAALQGAVIGGGLGLAVAADFRVASPSTRLAANFAALGFHHGFALSVTLPRVVGVHQATRILLEARRMTGAEAADIGLVDELVAEEDLAEASCAMAAGIAAQAPLAVRSIRCDVARRSRRNALNRRCGGSDWNRNGCR